MPDKAISKEPKWSTFALPPEPVGFWVIGPPTINGVWCAQFRIQTTYRPKWLHRKFMKLLLGIDWEPVVEK